MTRQLTLSLRWEFRRRRRLREVWEFLGWTDPDWAALTEPARRNHGWSRDLDQFYASGVEVVEAMTSFLPLSSSQRRALDWGTGPGRLASALATRYDEVVAVDIADSMLETAAIRLSEQGIDNVRLQNVQEYEPRGDCDLVISQFVLQHCASQSEVIETLRMMAASLAPGGWLVVEMPSRSLDLKGRLQMKVRLHRLLRGAGAPLTLLRASGLSGISSLTVPAEVMINALRSAGLKTSAWVDRFTGFEYFRYAAHKPEKLREPAALTPETSSSAAAALTNGATSDSGE
jgi:2-polyprenyl-3-methyl-5-hydroxy-6-metoxy-1,4-benzoquinol methylase